MPELTQFERVKSMMRYLPAKGTAGLARCAESTHSRSPWPPARMTATTLTPTSSSPGGPVLVPGRRCSRARRDPPGLAARALWQTSLHGFYLAVPGATSKRRMRATSIRGAHSGLSTTERTAARRTTGRAAARARRRSRVGWQAVRASRGRTGRTRRNAPRMGGTCAAIRRDSVYGTKWSPRSCMTNSAS